MTVILALALLTGGTGGDGWSKVTLGGEEIEIYRDPWGIPHVFAKSVLGAFRAEGYAEAEDRMWQMEMFRRASKGQAAELRGPAGLASDRNLVARGYSEEELRALFDAGSEQMRSIVTAYAEGVNAWIETGGDLPPEYEKLGVKPRPWSVTDSMAIGVAMARRFGDGGDIELTVSQVQATLAKKVGEEGAKRIMADLLKEGDPSAPTTMNDHLRGKPAPPRKKGMRSAPGLSDEAFAAWQVEREQILASRAAIGVPTYFGSNAWVVSPKKSASGNPILYGGPMMGFRAPSICNEIHVVAPGLNAAGMSFPGVPGVMIGWNDRVAWTTTSGVADLSDVYALELNPENPDEYKWRGGWKAFDVLEREIKVRGAAAEKVKVYRSVHGPLVGKRDVKNHRAHAIRMSFWKQEHRTMEAVFDMNFSRDVGEFGEAAKKVVTSHNFFCATRDGRIGFWYCGAHPVRKEGHVASLPQPGDGSMEWVGILSTEKWPQSVDPPHGFFANWNNKPSRAWPSVGFGKIFWGQKIIDELEAEEKLTFDQITAIARRTAYHAFLADHFKPVILDAARGSDDPAVKRAVEILEGWDNVEEEGKPGPRIVEVWTRSAMRRMFGKFVNPLMLASREVQRYAVDPMLYVLEGDRSLVKPKFDYAAGRDMKKLVVDALKEVMRQGEEKLAWKAPTINFRGEVGRVTSKSGRGTFQMAVEMTPEGPRAVTLAAPGQSERPGSKHYKDQIGLFEKWEYKPFVWRREEMK